VGDLIEQTINGETIFAPENQAAFDQIMDTLKVLARADPSDKRLVIAGLKA
jgi:magnesium-transporting ATPase (P-type)